MYNLAMREIRIEHLAISEIKILDVTISNKILNFGCL